MKTIGALIAVLICVLVGIFAPPDIPSQTHQQFLTRAGAASGAIFTRGKDARRIICTGTVIGHSNGYALFATARHCVWQDGNPFFGADGALFPNEEVSFSANQQGPFYTAIPWKLSRVDDVAILVLPNGGDLPSVPMGDELKMHVGDRMENFAHPLGFGLMDIATRFIAPALLAVPDGFVESYGTWSHVMPIDGTVAPGSSGSGLFSADQQALVGIVVGSTGEGGLNIAIPVSRLRLLLTSRDTGLPDPTVTAAHADTSP